MVKEDDIDTLRNHGYNLINTITEDYMVHTTRGIKLVSERWIKNKVEKIKRKVKNYSKK